MTDCLHRGVLYLGDHVVGKFNFKLASILEDICFASKKMANRCTLMSRKQARPIGCWFPFADSSKSVVKEGTFVFSGEGYLSTVIDIQQHWTASGWTHPSGANHWALPEKFTAPSALESGCCNSPGTMLRLYPYTVVIYFSYTEV